MKTKKSKTKKSSSAKLSKKARAEKRAARKGDGSFPDMILLTKEKSADGSGKSYFAAHKPDGDTLYKNGEVVAVYKLRRVSTITINRKIAR